MASATLGAFVRSDFMGFPAMTFGIGWFLVAGIVVSALSAALVRQIIYAPRRRILGIKPELPPIKNLERVVRSPAPGVPYEQAVLMAIDSLKAQNAVEARRSLIWGFVQNLFFFFLGLAATFFVES